MTLNASDAGAPDSTTDGGAMLPIVVGIGGSAGALAALMTLIEGLGDAPVAIVVVLHLSPHHESHLVEILQRITPLTVLQVTERAKLESGNVYVLAPGMNLITEDGHVQPAIASAARPSSVIDLFFRSLGEVHHERAISVVLSGTGQDGALGVAHVKENGGLTIAQAPDDCEHREMPLAAIDSGHVDLTLTAAEIGRRLTAVALALNSEAGRGRPPQVSTQEHVASTEDSDERVFHDILAALRVRTRHDFRHYKRATLMRRLERRVQIEQMPTIQAYRDLVRRSPEVLAPLLADFLISVTNFFRDGQPFETLQRDLLPTLFEAVPSDGEIRAWLPACASGEEAYSIAILMQELADQMAHPPRIQLFASDINEAALQVARAAVYPSNIAADVNDSRLMNFFDEEEGGRYRVRAGIRDLVVFARHNLLADPPFSRVDLVCCRNLLIYLDRTAQAAALAMFAYALKPGGYLFLGNAESIDAASADLFEVVNKKHRIYRLRPEAATGARATIPSHLVEHGDAGLPMAPMPVQHGFPTRSEEPLALIHERALVASSPPSVLVNAEAEIERVSAGAGRFVAFGEGIPTRNLLNNVAPDVRVELRAALYRAGASRKSVQTVFRYSDERDPSGKSTLALTVHPVIVEDGDPLHYVVVFAEPLEEFTRVAVASFEDSAAQEPAFRRLEEEISSLKSHLQETLDRSAASTEELKASNEEFQAINEELRSAKEELETSKEELQSVNEELTTVNFELRLKVDEAGRNNDDLRNLMDASDIATIFVDPGMAVKRYTPQASKLFALIPSDVGRQLMDVKSRLNYEEIVADATSVFLWLRPVERGIRSIDGEHYLARVKPYRTSANKIEGAVLTFINVTELRQAEERVKLTEERLRDATAANKDFAVISTDADGVVMTWNEGATAMFGYEPAQIIGESMDVLFTAADRAAGLPALERQRATLNGRASDERYHLREDGLTFYASGVLTPLHSGERTGFIKIARDVSVAKARQNLEVVELADERRGRAVAEADASQKEQFLAVVSHELKQPLNLMQLNAELLVRLAETRELPAVQRIGASLKQAIASQALIVNDLLDLSRIQTGKLQLHTERIDLAGLVRRLGEAFAEDAASKRIELKISAPTVVPCDCDPVRIEQIVWNLIGNAIKFTDANGRINVVLSLEVSRAKLVVADSGIGIDPVHLPHIFDLYDQGGGKPAIHGRPGLGIGLALVRELAQAHGGSIRAESEGEGKGSTFTLEIGLSAHSPLVVVEAPVDPLNRRILLVDDSEDGLALFADLLRIEGAQVDTASTAQEALTLFAAEAYDLVLSDVGLPDMSGHELMKQARELRPGGFLSVAITGYGGESDRREALAAGFDEHMSKPVMIDRLRELLEKLARR